MRRIILSAITLICILTLTLALMGCSETEPGALAVILGNHRYYPKVNLQTELAYDRIYDAAYSYGDCYVIVVDGDPYVAASYNISDPGKSIDDAKRRQIAKQNASQIIRDVSEAGALTPEIDTLSAIIKASGLLKSSNAARREILINDSGISTSGLLNFTQENLIESLPESIAEELEKLHSIPDLTGIHVVWAGLGEVTGDQARPTPEFKHKLQEIWRAVIVAGGGTVDFINVPLGSENTASLPYCSTVPIIQKSILPDKEAVTVIDEEDVSFKPDSCIFADVDTATAALEPIAEILASDRDKRIILAGSTASVGDERGCKELSLQRADACKELLCSLGAWESQIETVGIGRTVCFLRVDDLDGSGGLIAEQAVKNRAVFVADADSETANKIRGLR